MSHRTGRRKTRAFTIALITAIVAVSSLAWLSGASGQEGEAAPSSDAGSTARIVAVGDLVCAFGMRTPPVQAANGHDTQCDPRAVSRQVVTGDYDAFLPLGDLQYSYGGYWRYVKYWDRYYGKVVDITKPTAGNHEAYADFTGYVKYFGPGRTHMPARIGRTHLGDRVGRVTGYYSYDKGPWHLIALNSQLCMNQMWNLRTGWTKPIRGGGCRPDDPQMRWLARDLAANPDGCSLAYFHHPRFAIGGGENSQANQKPMYEMLVEGGVDIVLVGHEHSYQRWAPIDADGTPDPDAPVEFVVGTGGNSHRELPPEAEWPDTLEIARSESYGVLSLELKEGEAGYEFVAAEGYPAVDDAGTVSCH